MAAGSAVRAAATALIALARGDMPLDAVTHATEEARIHAREVLARTTQTTGWAADRRDMVEIALALRAIADRIDHIATGLDRVERRAEWVAPSGIGRDLTRAMVTALRALDHPTGEGDAHLASIEQLRDEGRSQLREGRRALVGGRPGSDHRARRSRPDHPI